MAQRRRFSAEYKREAVAMLDTPGVSVSQIAAELGIGAAMLGRSRRGCVKSRAASTEIKVEDVKRMVV